jgi:3-deoxy-7-phosphoheptulonate synthase
MGADTVADTLPPLLRAVARAKHPVVWACDPMHGNTYAHESGYKTRHFDAVMHEVEQFFVACRAADVWPGAVHVELTGDDVTECLGGGDDVRGEQLEDKYETRCDPRLNAEQSIEMAFLLAELLKAERSARVKSCKPWSMLASATSTLTRGSTAPRPS